MLCTLIHTLFLNNKFACCTAYDAQKITGIGYRSRLRNTKLTFGPPKGFPLLKLRATDDVKKLSPIRP